MEPKQEPRPPIERNPKDPKHGETQQQWKDPEYVAALDEHKQAERAPKQGKKKG